MKLSGSLVHVGWEMFAITDFGLEDGADTGYPIIFFDNIFFAFIKGR